MKYLIIFFFCAINLDIIYADDENSKSNPTTSIVEQNTQPAFPHFQNTGMSIPKVVYLKNLFEMNCLKEILENNRLKNRSVNNQEKREFLLVPNVKNNGMRPSNSNKRYTNAGANKNNPMQDKFLLIPSRLDPKYVNFQNRKELYPPKYPLENQKRIIQIRNYSEPIRALNKKEIPKNKESSKITPQVFPQMGFDRESIKKQEKVIEDVTKLTNKGVNKVSNPTTPNYPRINPNYKTRVTARPPTIHSYEVEEVIQEDINVDVNKNDENPVNEKMGEKRPPKPTMDDIKANIFEIINKLVNSDFESNAKGSDDDSKINKKSKLDEKLWKELTKKQNPPEKPLAQKPNVKFENPGGNKENRNFYHEIKNEKFGRREKPNNVQNPRIPQMLPNININNRKIQATPRVQIPGIYTPRTRQNLSYTSPSPKVMNTRNNFSNPNTFQSLNGRSGKIERINVQNMNMANTKSKQESTKMKESEMSSTRSTIITNPPSRTVPTSPPTTEKIKTSSPITSPSTSGSSTTLIQSVKFFSKTTVKTPEVSLQETTENPMTISVLEETTEIQTKKEDGLKNSRKMNFVTQNEDLENPQEQRRSDILIEEEMENGIGAMEYISKLKNATADLSYDSLSAKALSAIVPLVIDDIRKEKILPEDVKILSEVFGKYWSFIQDLSFDTNFDMMSLLKIKDKKDFEELFESYNSKGNDKTEESEIKPNSDEFDYVEEYKEMYKDLLLQELEDTGKKLRSKRDMEDDLKAVEATREYFESVQEEENSVDYLYEDVYSDAVNRNKEEDLGEIISLVDFFLSSKNSSENTFNF